jgi:hypothetical protein
MLLLLPHRTVVVAAAAPVLPASTPTTSTTTYNPQQEILMAFDLYEQVSAPVKPPAVLKLEKLPDGSVVLKSSSSKADMDKGSYNTILMISADGKLKLQFGCSPQYVNGLQLNMNGRPIVYDSYGNLLLG